MAKTSDDSAASNERARKLPTAEETGAFFKEAALEEENRRDEAESERAIDKILNDATDTTLAEATRRRAFEIGIVRDEPTGDDRVIVQWTPVALEMTHAERVACVADLATAIGCNLTGGQDLEAGAYYGAGEDVLELAIENIDQRRANA